MLVNTASLCGFTGQYRGLQALHERYSSQGLVIIAMPCNDFGKQEPACIADVKQFTAHKFHVTFPLTDKVHVKGISRHPFFEQVQQEFSSFAVPHWNFYKYIVDRKGYITTWFTPLSKPLSRKVTETIETALR